ncbi:hypothetical protein H5410_036692 [Solanum commersonii]|uniref:Uncharacterized protein n=1 Tax=Solanum commersonii TaxID=4109 RepID=A0A9J5Y853_SOLCO|nr:hypothetical protein H5410_036692 [Solanum commersonii]
MESMNDQNMRTNKELLEIKQAIGGMKQRDKELDNYKGESSAGGDNSGELTLDFPRFSGQDLKTWLYKVD